MYGSDESSTVMTVKQGLMKVFRAHRSIIHVYADRIESMEKGEKMEFSA